MISFNSQEGGTFLGPYSRSSFGLTENVDNGVSSSFFKQFVTKFAHTRNSSEETADLFADAFEFVYTPWPDSSNKYALRSQLVDFIGDYLYFAPGHEVANIHSTVAPVYMYEFAHRRTKGNKNKEWMGVVHGANVPYEFGIQFYPGLSSDFDAGDRNVSLFLMELYVNFAKSGDPTPQPVSGVTWERYNSSHRAYLRVDVHPKMAAAFAPRRMAFWNDYYPKLAQVQFDTRDKVVSDANVDVAMAMLFKVVLMIVFAMLY